MKNLQRLFALLTLTILLAGSASAGIIEIGVAPPPPPPDTTAMTNNMNQSGSIMDIGNAATDAATIEALILLQSLLGRV